MTSFHKIIPLLVTVHRIYPTELEMKNTTDTFRTASYLDIHPEIDSEGRLRTKANDERNDVNVSIVNLSCIYNNSNTCIQRTYLSDYTVLQSLRFLSGFW